MKIDDIKKAFDSVSANGELKEKVFSRLDAETEDFSQRSTSYIKLKKGGGPRFTAAAFIAAAAMIAMVFVINMAVFDADIAKPPADVTETASGVVEIPKDTALVTLRVVDENGVPVKNLRVDYLPVIIKQEDSAWEGWSNTSYSFDMENFDKGGTVPVVYDSDIELPIAYGDYCFYVSDASPNAEYDMFVIEQFNMISLTDGSKGNSQLVAVDENTEEIVLIAWGLNNQYEKDNSPE